MGKPIRCDEKIVFSTYVYVGVNVKETEHNAILNWKMLCFRLPSVVVNLLVSSEIPSSNSVHSLKPQKSMDINIIAWWYMYCNIKLALKSVASYKEEFSLAQSHFFLSLIES